MELTIAYIILTITVLVVMFSNKRDTYELGYRIAEDIFEDTNIRNAVTQINKMIDKLKLQEDHKKFEQGMRRCINDNLSYMIEILNRDRGGDWYFDNEELLFKDYVTGMRELL